MDSIGGAGRNREQDDLEALLQASKQDSIPERTNRYLFSSVGPLASIELFTANRALIVTGFSSIALFVGLFFIYSATLRHPAVVLLLGLILLSTTAVFTELSMLGAQAALLGIGLLFLARLLQLTVVLRPRTRPPVPSVARAVSESKSVAALSEAGSSKLPTHRGADAVPVARGPNPSHETPQTNSDYRIGDRLCRPVCCSARREPTGDNCSWIVKDSSSLCAHCGYSGSRWRSPGDSTKRVRANDSGTCRRRRGTRDLFARTDFSGRLLCPIRRWSLLEWASRIIRRGRYIRLDNSDGGAPGITRLPGALVGTTTSQQRPIEGGSNAAGAYVLQVAEEGTLRFSWSLGSTGLGTSQHLFRFVLPRSTISQLVLQLPADLEPRTVSGLASPVDAEFAKALVGSVLPADLTADEGSRLWLARTRRHPRVRARSRQNECHGRVGSAASVIEISIDGRRLRAQGAPRS